MMSALSLIFLLRFSIISKSVSQNNYYVIPNDVPFANCPADQPCMTLDQYSNLSNFTTGMNLVFLQGNHSLSESTLTLTNVSNITLKGEQLVIITCTNITTILCENVMDMKIESLVFLQKYTDEQKQEISVLHLINSYGVAISKTTFQGVGTMKTKLLLLEYSTVTVVKCAFKDIVGGAVYALAGTNLSISGSHFTDNTGLNYGGAVFVNDSNLLLDGNPSNIFTHNSALGFGGAIFCKWCSLIMRGNNTFYKNSALVSDRHHTCAGGTLHMDRGRLIMSGILHISHSTAVLGGAIRLVMSKAIFNGTSIVFKENVAFDGGGVFYAGFSSVILLAEYICFAHNKGGAVFSYNSNFDLLSGCFMNNTGSDVFDSAISLVNSQVIFMNVSIINSFQTTLMITSSNVTFNGITKITGNNNGGIIAYNSRLIFVDDVLFDSNISPNGGALNCIQGTIILSGYILFTHNRADNDGGAIYSFGTLIYMRDQVIFTFNRAGGNGGALFLDAGASIILGYPIAWLWYKQYHKGNSELIIMSNFAEHYGGGIYYVDSPTTWQCNWNSKGESSTLPYCFLQVGWCDSHDFFYKPIKSYNNTAGKDGSSIYGGLLDRCQLRPDSMIDNNSFLKIITINSTSKNRKEITSKPYELCFCNETNLTECKKTISIEVHRGQKFTLPLLANTQTGTTSTQITAITSSKAKLEINQTSQYLPDQCNILPYTLYSTESLEEVLLYPDGPCRDSGVASVIINATILSCPDGFTQKDEVCICDNRLHNYSIICTIGKIPHLTKAADTKLWVGALYENATYEGLILGSPCPIAYCKTDAVDITLDNLDIQCDLNHVGLLCGGCATNHSLMLGGSQCQVCSNAYISLMIPFAVAGIVLVIFITALRFTVAIGSFNGIILYANIIQANRMLLFPDNTRNVITVFLSWLNLDLGFQTCFYDGLDAYSQTWLQFAFPLYVWLLIGLIIFISRYSITVSKLIGHNPIAVLATLILMSYTKLLKTIIEVFSSLDLEYPGNKTVTVWLKDANVPYLQTRHFALTVVTTLVLIFFFLPYTLLLMFGFKLYNLSDRKYCYLINNIKPLLDSYYAPYRINARYWTGLLLLVRCALYVVFLMSSINKNKNLFAIVITFTILLCGIGVLYSGKIYEMYYINVVEVSIYFNLILLSAAELAGISSKALIYFLVGLVFMTMICISAYQLHLQYLIKTALWLKVKEKWQHCRKASRSQPQIKDESCFVKPSHDPKIITKAVIELREPLLDN